MQAVIRRLFTGAGLGRMSTGEYQANLNGLNMFFGAVLGFVLAGTEKLNAWQFGVLLMTLASIVITVLYISSSRQKLVYSLMAVVYAATLPEMMDFMLRGQGMVPDKVRPTLLVWIAMTVMVEFWARDKEAAAKPG
ncbi:hypothetical protein [Pelomonas sp. SE-A7]|uniref:hypothetical protein n=1 Tax=Pelomonas sp. SE-A7 TaxID=3054953 RepID=UPI00259CEEB4|nr:hypothetical protein [Pelomonas sp. SE-A7]MDM4766170.1 hypothetical protein [Pelomonas sp. SE-A7]